MKIAISCDPKLLPILRGALAIEARGHGIPDPEADRLARGIEEAARNAIRQPCAGEAETMLSVETVDYPDRLEFIVEGLRDKPESILSPSPGETQLEASGKFLIQPPSDLACCDASFCEANGLRLVKLLPGNSVDQK